MAEPQPSDRSRTSESGLPSLCAFVLGTPESGTSALTDVVVRLGLKLPSDEGRAVEDDRGPRATGESPSLTGLNDEVLAQLGGDWDTPPTLGEGWERSESLQRLRAGARKAFEEVFDQGAVVFSDPRNCLLLPMWRDVVDRPALALLVFRDPISVARSLQRARGLSLPQGLALWELYNHSAIRAMAGLPTAVIDFASLVAEPGRMLDHLGHLAETLGIPVVDTQLAGAADAISAEWQGIAETEQESDIELLPSQAELLEVMAASEGTYPFWLPPKLPSISAWTLGLLATVREGRLERDRDTKVLWTALNRSVDELMTLTEGLLDGTKAEPDTPPTYALCVHEDDARFHRWLELHESDPEPPIAANGPLISVVVPVYKPPLWLLERCVRSVVEQTYPNWELCLGDDASGDPAISAYLRRCAKEDRRIRYVTLAENAGISAATNAAIGLSTGEFVAFLDHDDELMPQALARVCEAVAARVDADVLYSDEDKLDENGVRVNAWMKPAWSPDLLLSEPYLCHLLVVRRALVDELGGLRSEFDGSQDYDLMLRATERARSVVHIPDILYHWRMFSGSASADPLAKPWAHEASRRALNEAIRRRGDPAVVEDGPTIGSYHVRRRPPQDSLVSIIIPFRDAPAVTRRCLESLPPTVGHDNFEVVLVNNDSRQPETEVMLKQLRKNPRVRLLDAPGPFNWSAINNFAAGESQGNLLLFLNNDMEARSQGWLGAMAGHCVRDEVGAVGARLLYPDGTVQHVGVILGMGGVAGHILHRLPEESAGYMGLAKLTTNYSAVTGACLMTRHAVFDSMGGFDEDLAIAFSDIDYCLRLRQKDLLVVFAGLAELTHYESLSRGMSNDAKEIPLFYARWRHAIDQGDPYLNPNLSRFYSSFALALDDEDSLRREALFHYGITRSEARPQAS